MYIFSNKDVIDGSAIVTSRLATIVLTEDSVDTPEARQAAVEARASEIGMDPATLVREVDEWIYSYVGPVAQLAGWVNESTTDVGIDELVISMDTIDTVDYATTMNGLRTFAAAVLNTTALNETSSNDQ